MTRPEFILDLAEVHEADARLYAPNGAGEGFALNQHAADAVDAVVAEYAAAEAEAQVLAAKAQTAKTRALVDHAVRLAFERAGVDPRLAVASAALFVADFAPRFDPDAGVVVVEHPAFGWAVIEAAVTQWLRSPDGAPFVAQR